MGPRTEGSYRAGFGTPYGAGSGVLYRRRADTFDNVAFVIELGDLLSHE